MSFTRVPQGQKPPAAIWTVRGLAVAEVCYGHAYGWPSLSTLAFWEDQNMK